MSWPTDPDTDEAPTPAAARPARPPADEGLVEDDEESIDLGRFVVALLKHKWLILAIIAVVTAASAFYASNEPRRYRASAQVLLDPPQPDISPVKGVKRGKTEINTAKEAALVKSRELARKAVKRLNLQNNPRFVSSGDRANGAVNLIKRQLAQALEDAPDKVGGGTTKPSDGDSGIASGQPAPPTSVLAQRYLGGLSVNINGNTGIMRVTYTSGDPQFAATAANTTAELYRQRKKKAQGRAVREANAWLRERVNDAREKLLESEQALEDLRQRKGLTETAAKSLPSKQLSRLNDRLLDAETEANKIRTRYQQAKRLLQKEASAENIGQVLQSDLIQRLRVQRLNLNQKIAQLKTRYREEHPKIQNARSELRNINDKIRSEAKAITENFKFKLEVLQDRIQRLKDQIAKVEKEVERLRKAEGKVRTLESEVQANRDLYRTLLQRLQETSLREQMKPEAEASIINRAQPPSGPFYPNEKVFISAALLGSSILACALAIGLEFLRRGVGSLSELASAVDVRPLAVLPHEKPPRKSSLVESSRKLEATTYVDAVRGLRQVLLLREYGEPLPCLLVTSPWAGDGKTTVAHSLAALTQSLGTKCLVVECHRGEGHDLLRSDYEDGWIQHLEDGKPLADIVLTHPEGGFDFLPAGRSTERAYDLQASQNFAEVINGLRPHYDTIILDAPSLLDDIRILSHPDLFDDTLLLLRANVTPETAISYASRRLAEAGVRNVGAALNMVDMRDYERRESGEYRATLDRPGRKLPQPKRPLTARLLPFVGGLLAVLGAAALVAERLVGLPPG